MKQVIKESQIEAEILVCPYCMDEVSYNRTGCCGESSAHFDTAYVTQDETFLKHEVVVIKD